MSTPLALDVRGPGSPDGLRRTFAQPFVLIGRTADAQLTLADDRVSRRHAYLQVVRGRLFCIDLGSRTGTLHGGVRRPSGWVGHGQPLGIGPFEVRPRWGDDTGPAPEPGASSGPGDGAVPGHAGEPEAVLEISGNGSPPGLWHLRREVALIGRVAACHVRFGHPDVSKYHCSLVRTPSGLWVVDLLSTGGTFVDGRRVHSARLLEGEALKAGPFTIRSLSASEARPRLPSWEGGIFFSPALRPSASVTDRDGIPVGGALQPRPRGESAPVWTKEGDRFQQTLVTVLHLFGQMHRDHMEVVHEQLEQIRRLAEAIERQRVDPGRLDAAIQDLEQDGDVPAPASGPRAGAGALPRDRVDLKEIEALVSERLATLDRDQQAGWKKILRALAGL